MLKVLLALLALCVSVANADGVYTRSRVGSSSSSSGSSSPTTAGGSVTGANQYRDASGKIQGDNSIIDSGGGSLTLVGISASSLITALNVSATNLMVGPSSGANQSTFRLLIHQSSDTPQAGFGIQDVAGNGRISIDAVNNFGMFRGRGTSLGITMGADNRHGVGIGAVQPLATWQVGLTTTDTMIVAGPVMINSTSLPTAPITVPGLASNAGTHSVCYNNTTGVFTYSAACTSSDMNLKKNIADRTGGLARILALTPVTYEWRDEELYGSGTQVGFIAQDVEQVIPQAAFTSDDGKKGIVVNNMMPDMVSAIQELTARVEALEAQAK